jgi:hypothetical protein
VLTSTKHRGYGNGDGPEVINVEPQKRKATKRRENGDGARPEVFDVESERRQVYDLFPINNPAKRGLDNAPVVTKLGTEMNETSRRQVAEEEATLKRENMLLRKYLPVP